MTPTGTYRALAGERSFDVQWRDGQLYLDDQPVAYTWERVADRTYLLIMDGRSLPVVVEADRDGRVRVTLEGRVIDVQVKDEKALLLERFGLDAGAGAAEREVRAPMPGLVLRVLVEPGQAVQAGDGLIVLEAMKMENELRAAADGTVKAIHAAEGAAVGKNELLLEFEG